MANTDSERAAGPQPVIAADRASAPDVCFLCGRPFSQAGGPIIPAEDNEVALCRVCGMIYEYPDSCCG